MAAIGIAPLLPLHKPLACMLLLVACLFIRDGASQQQHENSSCFPSDRQALRSFAEGFHAVFRDDSNPAVLRKVSIKELWSSEHDCCSWMGVSCTTTSSSTSALNTSTSTTNYISRVTELSLSFIEFSVSSASILQSLCSIPFLSTLRLASLPSIYSPSAEPIVLLQIPQCLGNQLSLLQVLQLYSLYLKGPIPSSFSRLLHLQQLDLSYNPNISGPLLPLLLLPNLTSLSLSYCNFSGSLPNFHTPLLQTLSLSNNAFSGPLPSFNDTPLLQSLSLSSNKISGPIPSSISTYLFNLQYLNLQGNSLSGPLPRFLCELSHLKTLVLSGNLLSIAELLHPEYCTQLINLTSLDLSSNHFTGRLPPWIGYLSSLNTLDLSFNQFASPLPDEWQNLHNLSVINLGSGNSLNATRLPDWLFRFPKLTQLKLVSMGLQSEDVLCSTRVSMLNNTLQLLDLSGNNITGRDLLECFSLHNFSTQGQLLVWVNENPLSISLSDVRLSPTISSLGLSGCNLTGFMADKVFEGRRYLNLSHNHLVGKIPTKYTNLTGAWIIDLSDNYFTGFDSYGSFHSLLVAQLSNNLIAGDVSTVLHTLGLALENSTSGTTPSLWAVALSNNELVGQIPTSLAECHPNFLTTLFLDNNNLTGQIPENFGTFLNMLFLSLSNNLLNGTIPATIITAKIIALDLSYNKLEGDLKTLLSFSTPSSLTVLGLAHNRVSGSIPPFLGNFTPRLKVIDLSHNNLIGNIPQDLSLPSFQKEEIISDFDINIYAANVEISLVIKGVKRTLPYVLRNFRFLDLSENQLEGVIPSRLGDLSAMMQLNLSHNNLSGAIPEAFGKLLNLETLDLSFNQLSGSIPPSLSSLTLLGTFNVSYNEALVGRIPSGTQLQNNESYIGDPMLCGYQVQRACPLANVDITRSANNTSTIIDHIAAWINEWISIPGLCLGIVVAFFGVLWILHGPHITGTSCIPWW